MSFLGFGMFRYAESKKVSNKYAVISDNSQENHLHEYFLPIHSKLCIASRIHKDDFAPPPNPPYFLKFLTFYTYSSVS